jgi:hypothetical protein
MFGYGFMSKATPDRVDKSAKPYRHPQSFYFSGYPLAPANAPMVSQDYPISRSSGRIPGRPGISSASLTQRRFLLASYSIRPPNWSD